MTIRVGIGGWNFPPWRGVFYPDGLAQSRELEYASTQLSAIEINSTFYGTQSPESFRRWRDAAPDGFMFSVKASRAATYRRDPALAAPSITHFLQSGITELGPKLGPIFWQFAPTRRFDAGEIAGFLALLPPSQDGLALRHVIEARHPSFADPAYVALLREHGVAAAIIDADKQVLAGDITADFVYARLERCQEAEPTGYDAASLATWETRFRRWAAGNPVDDVKLVATAPPKPGGTRDCFVYFISGAKIRAPAAAMAMLKRLSASG